MPGTLDNTPFHIFRMKKSYYTMILMSTYGELESKEDHEARRVFKNNNGEHKTKKVS